MTDATAGTKITEQPWISPYQDVAILGDVLWHLRRIETANAVALNAHTILVPWTTLMSCRGDYDVAPADMSVVSSSCPLLSAYVGKNIPPAAENANCL